MAMEARTHLLEVLQTEILARLPLKTISRFKSVCKTWKSTIESAYFRRLFLSLHRNSSWSLMHGTDELIVFHGYNLPKSPAPLIPPSFKRYHIGDCIYRDSSGGLVLITDGSDKAYCYVGSPVLQQWIRIPPPPSDPRGDSTVFGLTTRLDEDGVVLSFKVVRIASYEVTNDYLSSVLTVLVYSSETGVWTCKVIHSPRQIGNMSNINLNGTVYFGCLSVPGILLAHDFYSESDQFRVVKLPDYPDYNKDYKRTLTTSEGFVTYVRALAKKEETVLKIWRLNNDDDTWHLLWEDGFPIIGNYVPMAMNPFDIGIVYLWSQQDHYLVSCNLWKGDYRVLEDASSDCFIDRSVCKKSVDELWHPRSSSDGDEHLDFEVCIWLIQFVIPRWMESVPRPPQAEMIDTRSLLSHATATHERMVMEVREMLEVFKVMVSCDGSVIGSNDLVVCSSNEETTLPPPPPPTHHDPNSAFSVSAQTIRITASHGSSHHDRHVSSHATFGDVKKALVQKTGLESSELKILFRGVEKDDGEQLQASGVKDGSKVVLVEEPKKRVEQVEQPPVMTEEMVKTVASVKAVSGEIDKFSDKVVASEVFVNGGTKVAVEEFDMTAELLMRQLLKLDGIEAEREPRVQRKAEVRRVQKLQEAVDRLKGRCSNPFVDQTKAAAVSTKWETFGNSVGSLNSPPASPSANVTQDWEKFD